jgi:alpha-beta hydrolase superfamily lysophospholipase
MNKVFWLLLLFLASCSSMENPPRPEPPQADEGYFFTASDGVDIFIYEERESGRPKQLLFLLSGVTGINHRNEQRIIDTLADEGRWVIIIHPRGTGFSEGIRGDYREFDRFILDHEEILNSYKDRFPEARHIAFGHSMSTALALELGDDFFDAYILVNPPFKRKKAEGMSPGFWEYVVYASYTIFNPHVPIVNMAGDPAAITDPDDRLEAEIRQQDPLLVRYFSMYTMMQANNMMQRSLENASQAEKPLLLLYGQKDQLVDQQGVDEIYSAWAGKEKEYRLISEGSHGSKTVFLAAELIQKWYSALEAP